MVNAITSYFYDYQDTAANFKKFHNQVINMPRDKFSNSTLKKIQSLASYLLLLEGNIDNEGITFKKTLDLIIDEIRKGNYPVNKNRNNEFESRYFRKDCDIDSLYKKEGRMFRHLMDICVFFGLIRSISKQKKIINFDSCRELVLSDDDTLIPIFRNNLLYSNIKDNDFINSVKGISVQNDADYRPAYAILKYIKEIKRPVTIFEASILLGRIDRNVQKEKDILSRAVKVGKELPKTLDNQIKTFFGSMNWMNGIESYYQYSSSQEPHFKFKNFILYMDHFDLIRFNSNNGTIYITDYAEELLEDELPVELVDLEGLLEHIDDDQEDENRLKNIILRKRSPVITKAIKEDSKLVVKLNKRSLRKPRYNRKGKKIRNQLISEISKIRADYTCEATGLKTFRTPSGNYYVESHHIIEFSTEDGPDITENLLVLGPEKHKLIHHACEEELDDFYNHLKSNGKLNIGRFERMHNAYGCLTKHHIKTLYNKKLISSIDKDKLVDMVESG